MNRRKKQLKMKTLYRVKAAFRLEELVSAESEQEAADIAEESLREMCLDHIDCPELRPVFHVFKFEPEDGYPLRWTEDCYPYGGDGLTVGEMVEYENDPETFKDRVIETYRAAANETLGYLNCSSGDPRTIQQVRDDLRKAAEMALRLDKTLLGEAE